MTPYKLLFMKIETDLLTKKKTVTKRRGIETGLFMNNKWLCRYFSEWGSIYIYMSTYVTVTHRNKLASNKVLESSWAVSAGTAEG